MSETRQATRSRILEHARVRFNERGIDNVGVRDLARDLEMSPGNLSYWFASKEELVRALLLALRDRNAARPAPERVDDVETLLAAFRSSLLAQLDYRCLTESIVHVTRTWPALAPVYRETELRRRADLAATIRRLASVGALVGIDGEEGIARLVATWSLVARFWLSERGISYPDCSDQVAVEHYLALVAHSLLPFLAPVDRDRLRHVLGAVLVEAAVGAGAASEAG